jgi:hypothetical protein
LENPPESRLDGKNHAAQCGFHAQHFHPQALQGNACFRRGTLFRLPCTFYLAGFPMCGGQLGAPGRPILTPMSPSDM